MSCQSSRFKVTGEEQFLPGSGMRFNWTIGGHTLLPRLRQSETPLVCFMALFGREEVCMSSAGNVLDPLSLTLSVHACLCAQLCIPGTGCLSGCRGHLMGALPSSHRLKTKPRVTRRMAAEQAHFSTVRSAWQLLLLSIDPRSAHPCLVCLGLDSLAAQWLLFALINQSNTIVGLAS